MISVAEINKMVFENNWEGDVDNLVLKERIESLLEQEKLLIKIQNELKAIKQYLLAD